MEPFGRQSMEGVTKATIRATADDLTQMIRKASLKPGSPDPIHFEVYLSVQEDQIDILASERNNAILSYSTFGGNFFDSITVNQNVLTVDNNRKAETIVNVTDFLKYLTRAQDNSNSTVEMALLGEEDDRLCHALQFHGTIQTQIMLPASESNLKQIPLAAVKRFDENTNSFLNSDGESLPATIDTDVREIQRIVDIVDNRYDIDLFPIIIQDSELYVNIDTEEVAPNPWGRLNTERVVGPDLSNKYKKGFEEVFKTLSGIVRLETGPSMPLCILQQGDNQVIRHVLAPVEE
jgi:hypothetical protein